MLERIAAGRGIEVTVRGRETVFIFVIPANEGVVMLFIRRSPWQLRISTARIR
jgi:antitoxin (DNA-binding transcriptional repressor) of toxin-antitoxin stability system